MNQTIPNSNGDNIENPKTENWSKGECAPKWVVLPVHTEQFTEQYT